MRQGRCWTCKIAFRFKHPRRLRDACCPYCGDKLKATTHKLKSVPWETRDVAYRCDKVIRSAIIKGMGGDKYGIQS